MADDTKTGKYRGRKKDVAKLAKYSVDDYEFKFRGEIIDFNIFINMDITDIHNKELIIQQMNYYGSMVKMLLPIYNQKIARVEVKKGKWWAEAYHKVRLRMEKKGIDVTEKMLSNALIADVDYQTLLEKLHKLKYKYNLLEALNNIVFMREKLLNMHYRV